MQLTLSCADGGRYAVEARLARVVVTCCGHPFVEFPCPGCGKQTACPIEPHVALRLIGLGVRAGALLPPAEATEVHEGPPLSADELLDFHLLLARPDWLERLERELAGPSP